MSGINDDDDDDDGQRDINAENFRIVQDVILEETKYCPKNTAVQYKRRNEWPTWCRDEKHFTDGRKNKYKKENEEYIIGRDTVLSNVNAIIKVYTNQVSFGLNNNAHPRGSVLRQLLDTCDRKEHGGRRKNFEDRGKHTLKDGYTKEQLLEVSRYFMQCNTTTDLRNRFDFLLGHSIFARGEDKCHLQFADPFLLELENEGPTPCYSLVATITQGKTNQHNRVSYGATICNSNVEACPVGALAIYFFGRSHLDMEPFPDFSRRECWYNTFVLKASDCFEEMKYGTQYKAFQRGLASAGINSSKVTHVNRGSALNMIDDEDVSDNQQRRVGRWGTDRMVGYYLSSLPNKDYSLGLIKRSIVLVQ